MGDLKRKGINSVSNKQGNDTGTLAEPVYYGPWRILAKVEHVMCQDGHRRVAVPTRLGAESSTADSVPARITVYCRVHRKNVAVSGVLRQDAKKDWEFTAYEDGRNFYVCDSNESFRRFRRRVPTKTATKRRASLSIYPDLPLAGIRGECP